MDHRISRPTVLNNLIRFKDHLLESGSEVGRGNERTYRALLNRKSGDIRFAKKISDLGRHISQNRMKNESITDWKEVVILVRQKTPFETAHFEILDRRKKEALTPSDLEPLAWKIASETLTILNRKGKEVKGRQGDLLPEEAVVRDLSDIHLAPAGEQIEDLPGWMGTMSRLDAEKTLESRGVGTYLIREGDEITISIAFHFSEENLLSIHPYLITVVEKEKKISDILILQTEKGWTLYRDDPNLNDQALYQFHPSPKALLHALSAIARFPLS